jgi:HEAT repeat protein
VRHIDEILSLYPSQEPQSKRYLLRRLEHLTITADARLALDLLQEAATSEVADFSLLAEDRFYSRYEKQSLLRASGQGADASGDWSRFFDQQSVARTNRAQDDLEQAAAPRLAALVPGLEACLKRGESQARGALKVLSRIRVPASLEAIRRSATKDSLLHDCMAAYSIFGGEQAEQAGLQLARAWEGTPWHSGLIFSMRGFTSPEVLRYLQGLLGEVSLHPAAAAALEGLGDQEALPLLDQILASPNPWTQLQAIDTLGRIGGDASIQKLQEIFRGASHPLVQVACLQATAATGSARGGAIGMMGLRISHPMVQAAAIETLVSLPVPKANYREPVLRLLDTDHPRLAMNAALACVVLDSKRAAQRIHKLIQQGSAAHLMQGIHCLAYMDHPSTAPLLAALIARCPTGQLRLQAIRALGRHAENTPGATAHLIPLLRHEEWQARATTAWFLASCENFARADAIAALATALGSEQNPSTRIVFLTSLGLAGPLCRESSHLFEASLEEGPSIRDAAAWALVSACGGSAEGNKLGANPSRAVKSWSCLHSWFQRGEGMDQLGGLLASSEDEEVLRTSLRIARLAAEVSTFVSEPDNLTGLFGALSDGATGSSTKGATSPEKEELNRLLSSGSHRGLFGRGDDRSVRPQLIQEDSSGTALPTGEEASVALGNHIPSATEIDQAMMGASYYSLPKEAIADIRAAQDQVVHPASERVNPFGSDSFAEEAPATQSLRGPFSQEEKPDADDPEATMSQEDEDIEPKDGLARLILFLLSALVCGQAVRHLLLK